MLKDFLQGKPIRHPIHPMLVHFPIGLFTLSLLLDLWSLASPATPGLLRTSFYAMLAGVIGALLAAVPGFVDYSDIRSDHPGKRIATAHMILNLLVVAMYGINLGLRAGSLAEPHVAVAPLVCSLIGFTFLSISGYLGGKLVYDEGIAVGRHKRRTPTPEETPRFSTAGEQGNPVFVAIPQAERLTDGETLRIQIDDYVMTLAKIDNRFYAFQEFCTHRFGPLSEGCISGIEVECPWHNSRFDVRSGKVTNGPAKVDLKTFPVENRDGKIFVGVSKSS